MERGPSHLTLLYVLCALYFSTPHFLLQLLPTEHLLSISPVSSCPLLLCSPLSTHRSLLASSLALPATITSSSTHLLSTSGHSPRSLFLSSAVFLLLSSTVLHRTCPYTSTLLGLAWAPKPRKPLQSPSFTELLACCNPPIQQN